VGILKGSLDICSVLPQQFCWVLHAERVGIGDGLPEQ
jgi:hypothetical protein